MSKKHFISIANMIRETGSFTPEQIAAIANWLATQNPLFNRQKWIDFVNRK